MIEARELTDAEFVAQCPRAFVVSEPDEERAVVVWARTAIEARREAHGVDDLGCMNDEHELRVRRAPEFDDLDGQPLRQRQLEAGWWFECNECYQTVCEETGIVVNGDVYCKDCKEHTPHEDQDDDHLPRFVQQ